MTLALWRSLRGFPEDEPYRSIGVEPMLGRVFDLAAAGDGDAVRVPKSGEVRRPKSGEVRRPKSGEVRRRLTVSAEDE